MCRSNANKLAEMCRLINLAAITIRFYPQCKKEQVFVSIYLSIKRLYLSIHYILVAMPLEPYCTIWVMGEGSSRAFNLNFSYIPSIDLQEALLENGQTFSEILWDRPRYIQTENILLLLYKDTNRSILLMIRQLYYWSLSKNK